jgi:hypothetical protein
LREDIVQRIGRPPSVDAVDGEPGRSAFGPMIQDMLFLYQSHKAPVLTRREGCIRRARAGPNLRSPRPVGRSLRQHCWARCITASGIGEPPQPSTKEIRQVRTVELLDGPSELRRAGRNDMADCRAVVVG